MPRVDEYASTSGLDADDSALWVVDGALKNVPIAANRGYIDASHYADLNEVVLHTCESITGFVANRIESVAIQLDSAIFTTGANSVKASIFTNRNDPPSFFYVNLPSDVSLSTGHVEAAFNLRTNAQESSFKLKAFVASAVDHTGTLVYADDFPLQMPDDIYHNNAWYTIRIPLSGLGSIRSIGLMQHEIPSYADPTAATYWFDNIVLREATGIDRAVYGAPANSHIVIPSSYTSAKAQLAIHREPAGITWDDRRSGHGHARRFA